MHLSTAAPPAPQARSRTPSQEERALLEPFMTLLMNRKTIREVENYNE